MKIIAMVTVALALFPEYAGAAGLNELINQNVRDATGAYQKTLPPAQRSAKPARLWIHISNIVQKPMAEEVLARVTKALPSEQIEKTPVQIVDSGPRRSELRFFKKEDEPQARILFESLRGIVPRLELKDFSREYEGARWIKPGHYELWLAAELDRLQR